MHLDPSDILAEAIKHEREAEKCRSLISQAEKINILNRELTAANKKTADLEQAKKDDNGSAMQSKSRISKQPEK